MKDMDQNKNERKKIRRNGGHAERRKLKTNNQKSIINTQRDEKI